MHNHFIITLIFSEVSDLQHKKSISKSWTTVKSCPDLEPENRQKDKNTIKMEVQVATTARHNSLKESIVKDQLVLYTLVYHAVNDSLRKH